MNLEEKKKLMKEIISHNCNKNNLKIIDKLMEKMYHPPYMNGMITFNTFIYTLLENWTYGSINTRVETEEIFQSMFKMSITSFIDEFIREYKYGEITSYEYIIKKIIQLNNNTKDGIVIDGDTILADIMNDSSLDHKVTGLSNEILETWLNSSDKKGIEKIFLTFTDVEFTDYLNQCLDKMDSGK